jgi:hypothetical protein
MQTTVELDASNRIVLLRELRRAAGIPWRQKLRASATPGRIVLEMEANTTGRIVKRGKLKVWTGGVPATPIAEAWSKRATITAIPCTRLLPAAKTQSKS